MRESPALEQIFVYRRPNLSTREASRIIDPLAYSLEFERALLPKITLLQAILDHVSMQLRSMHQRRHLTRLEHNSLAMAAFAYESGPVLGLKNKESAQVAAVFLTEAMRTALEFIMPESATDKYAGKARIETVLKRLGAPYRELECLSEFRAWDDSENLSDLLDLECGLEVKLKEGNELKKLHYLCQLSIFTSTPKDPDDYPLSVLVTPSDYFSLSTMWARRPHLWERNALVTQSGKMIISKIHADSNLVFRRDLGSLADLHLELAELIRKNYRF